MGVGIGLEAEPYEDLLLVRLSKPEKYNPLGSVLLERLKNIVEAYRGSGKVLLLTGKGRLFSAGIDLFEVASYNEPSEASKPFKLLGEAMKALLEYDAPTITYLNGPAIAGGGELALSTDIILAGENATLEWPEPRFGIAAPMLLSYAAHTGSPRLAALALTGERIGAREALAMGLVHKIVGGEEEAVEEARRISQLYRGGREAYALMLGELRSWKRKGLERILPVLERLASQPVLLERARAFVESRRR